MVDTVDDWIDVNYKRKHTDGAAIYKHKNCAAI